MHSFSSTPPVGVYSKDSCGRSFSPPIEVIFESRDDQQHCSRKTNALSSTKLYWNELFEKVGKPLMVSQWFCFAMVSFRNGFGFAMVSQWFRFAKVSQWFRFAKYSKPLIGLSCIRKKLCNQRKFYPLPQCWYHVSRITQKEQHKTALKRRLTSFGWQRWLLKGVAHRLPLF